ncbi:AAA family ATPase [Nocardioides sp. GY 10127]|uniref:AAA family ATPase n=1 Tax=Nocardioides sp. GY 10127 TaxID=2569762 RepID=UPI0010A7DF32|nr:AAA family ATPase [Nocardioides sp. GY 10127]TIC81003.1 NUDIX domain-containing protein [Nocardioides sp. GY 10127]
MPRVHLLAGLPGAGKTTLARRLERDVPAVRFTLDEWVQRLHGVAQGHRDFPVAAVRCQELVWDTALQVLASGTDVVLDWNCWSRARRATWRDRALRAGADPVLHHLEVDLDTAVGRLGPRADAVHHLAGLFEPPTPDEGLLIERDEAPDPAPLPERAVAVVLDPRPGDPTGPAVLVVLRRRHGTSYAVLPGGGVEPGESVPEAAARELREETGVEAVVRDRLACLEHPDRRAHYLRLEPLESARTAPTLSGPEVSTVTNLYRPAWVPVADLDAVDLRPVEARDVVRAAAALTPDR